MNKTTNMIFAATLTFGSVLAAGVGSAAAYSYAPHHTHELVVHEATARAPLGFQLMCLQNPQECKAGGASKLNVNSSAMATLKRVNTSVNSSIRPRHDRGSDTWTVNASAGDCEDYVMTKRHRLIQAGFSPSALRIAYVKTRSGEGHAVLVVRTNKGDMTLDNLTNAIKPLSQTGHRVISMSGANPAKWG